MQGASDGGLLGIARTKQISALRFDRGSVVAVFDGARGALVSDAQPP